MKNPGLTTRRRTRPCIASVVALALLGSFVLTGVPFARAASASAPPKTVRISSLTGGCRISGESNIPVDVAGNDPTEIILDCGSGDWAFPDGKKSQQTSIGTIAFTEPRVLLFTPTPNQSFLASNARVTFENKVERGAPLPKLGIELRSAFRPIKVYALGDSWTAAFGYYGDGTEMPVTALPFCKPGSGVLNDRCSSNSPLTSLQGDQSLQFLPDYGYSNNVSWVAQLTRQLASAGADVSTFSNQAISGATPSDFLTGGGSNSVLTSTVAADPNLTFMTLGGNPLLGDVLFGLKGCEDDRKAGKLYDCVTGLINNEYKVPERLASIYEELLKAPNNHVVISSYMSAGATYFPFNNYSFGEFTIIARAINAAIGRAVDAARAKVGAAANGRLLLVPPVDPPLGLAQSNGPVECKRGNVTFRADGSSVLATVVQVDMSISSQANRFCGSGAQVKVGSEWKDAGTNPWFNSADLGTHLTRLGNQQLANAAFRAMQDAHLGGL